MKTVKGEDILLAMNNLNDTYIRDAGERLNPGAKGVRRTGRRVSAWLVAAIIVALAGISAYAAGEIYEQRSLKNDPALQQQAETGAAELERFTHTGLPIVASDTALYMDNTSGQSDVIDFDYSVEGTGKSIGINYYGSGEIQALDARELFYPVPEAAGGDEYAWFREKYPDNLAYKERLIEAAPGLIDALYADGWIKHQSEDILKCGIQDHLVFWDGYAQIRVLMKDDSGYELWLQPDSFEFEGFMYWKPKDAAVIRNGFFPALKEDRVKEWWDELMANGVG